MSAPVSALIDLSKTAEMMVVGWRHTSLERALLGSVSYGLVHHAQCPVAVVHDDDPLVLRPATAPIVVGIDFSAASELATDIAFDEASLRGVELVAVHAWTDVSIRGLPGFSWSPSEWSNQKAQAEEDLAKWLERWRVRYPDVVVRCIVVRDWPAQRLLERRVCPACRSRQSRSRWRRGHAIRLRQQGSHRLHSDSRNRLRTAAEDSLICSRRFSSSHAGSRLKPGLNPVNPGLPPRAR